MLPENQINTNPETYAVETASFNPDAIVEVEDATADVNVAAPLAPAGIYPVKYQDAENNGLAGHSTAPKPGTTQRDYVGGMIAGKIQAEGEYYNNAFVSEYLNSLTFSGKPTSDLHHFLNCAGNPAQNRMTAGQLLAFSQETLANSPAVYTQVDWEAQYPTGEKTKAGKDEYKTVKVGNKLMNTMKNFPQEFKDGKPTGRYVPQVENPLTGEPINARLKVKAFFTPTEAQKRLAKA